MLFINNIPQDSPNKKNSITNIVIFVNEFEVINALKNKWE
ncbi:MAG: hypothetical protein ACI8WT_002065 [Clostridium sp.]|jgi:hypothetical protein